MELERYIHCRIHDLHAHYVLAGAIHILLERGPFMRGAVFHHWNVRHHTIFSPQPVAQKLQAPEMAGIHLCLLRRASSPSKLNSYSFFPVQETSNSLRAFCPVRILFIVSTISTGIILKINKLSKYAIPSFSPFKKLQTEAHPVLSGSFSLLVLFYSVLNLSSKIPIFFCSRIFKQEHPVLSGSF
jgi:hypothetical protein